MGEKQFLCFLELLLCVRLKLEIYCPCRAADARSRDRLLIILFCKLLISVSEGNLPINKQHTQCEGEEEDAASCFLMIYKQTKELDNGIKSTYPKHLIAMGGKLIERECFRSTQKASLWLGNIIDALSLALTCCIETAAEWKNLFLTFSETQSFTVIN